MSWRTSATIFQDRLTRGRSERMAAKLAWEAIQRIELCATATAACEIVDQTAHTLGCELVRISCNQHLSPATTSSNDPLESAASSEFLSGPSAIFRLSGGRGLWITVSLGLTEETPLAADIVFRYLQRLCQALAEQLDRLDTDRVTPEADTPAKGPLRSSGSRMNPPSVTEAFMDGIQTYRGSAAPPNPIRPGPAALTVNPAAVKTTSNYFKALRRRFWMVLAVAVPLAIAKLDRGSQNAPGLPGQGRNRNQPAGSRPGALDARLARPRSARSVEPGELRPQPGSPAPKQVAGRAGRQRPGHRGGIEPVRRPRRRALQVAHGRPGEERRTRSSSAWKAWTPLGPRGCWRSS